MDAVIRWFVNNPVAANMLMFVIVAGGILSFTAVHKEEFPNPSSNTIAIITEYPGASPEDVEISVCIPIEESLEGISGILKIYANASENICIVQAEYDPKKNGTLVLDDIRTRIQSIDYLPEEAKSPQVNKITQLTLVMQIIVVGRSSEHALKEIALGIRDGIADLTGVSAVNIKYVRPYEIAIEISETKLREYNLTLDGVAQLVREGALVVPAGNMYTSEGDVLLKTNSKARNLKDLASIPIVMDPNGSVVMLDQIAVLEDGFEENQERIRLDGNEAVMIEVKRVGNEDVLDVARNVKQRLDRYRQELPEGIDIVIWNDESQDLADRFDLLLTNAISGLLLVLFVIALFLKPMLGFWVAFGIPVSIIGAFSIFPFAGIAINTLSIIAFILALGLLVDDSIVVGERIYFYRKQGVDAKESAIRGTTDVSTPVIFGVMTTMVAFLPFIVSVGAVGEWFYVIGSVVIFSLLFSIVESHFILPVHLAHHFNYSESQPEAGDFSKTMQTYVAKTYVTMLAIVLRWRYVSVSIGIAILISFLGLINSGRAVVQFFPEIIGERVYATLKMPAGTNISTMRKYVEQLEEGANQLSSEIEVKNYSDGKNAVNHVISSIGAPLSRSSFNDDVSSGAQFAEVAIELNEPESYSVDPRQVATRWREIAGDIPGAVEMIFTAAAFSTGKAIDIQLRGEDIKELRSAADYLKDVLRQYSGVVDITDSFESGKRELQLDVKHSAQRYGLTADALGKQIRAAFYGIEVIRHQRGAEDVRIMVRYPHSERETVGDLEAMMIRVPGGEAIPFHSVAKITELIGPSTIKRMNGKRIINIQANVNRNVVAPEEILLALGGNELAALPDMFSGVDYQLAGEAEERSDTMENLLRSCLVALLIMYSLLAIPLKSYVQPLIIMSVIPFGLVGAVIGHILLDVDLMIFSFLGVIAMAGVVINSSLVLVDYINRRRREGVERVAAAMEASQIRLRPILLTSITTFVGLIPLMINHTFSTLMFVPMAVSLAFGVLIATFSTLLLVPAMYVILEDWKSHISPKIEAKPEEGIMP